MLKIGAATAILFVTGYIAFPQFRAVIISLAPFALLALCPLSMLFMGGMMGNKKGQTCSSCERNPAEKAKHAEVHAH